MSNTYFVLQKATHFRANHLQILYNIIEMLLINFRGRKIREKNIFQNCLDKGIHSLYLILNSYQIL